MLPLNKIAFSISVSHTFIWIKVIQILFKDIKKPINKHSFIWIKCLQYFDIFSYANFSVCKSTKHIPFHRKNLYFCDFHKISSKCNNKWLTFSQVQKKYLYLYVI